MEPILTGHSIAQDESVACQDLAVKINASDAKLNIIFFSINYDKDKLAQELQKNFTTPTIACSTAGEISHHGFSEDSLVGMSLQGDAFEVSLITVDDLRNQNSESILSLKKELEKIQNLHRERMDGGKTFGIVLIDGLSVKEEEFIYLMDDILNGLPLIGGSASDQLNFKQTLVYANGQLRVNAATLAIITTTIPFEIFKVQNFSASESKFVITSATPQNRTVQEIEGMPAGIFYATKLGLEVSQLNPTVFSKNPVMLQIGDDYYVRSIQKMNPDLSLTFYCAIDNGLVLRLGRLRSIADTSTELFKHLNLSLGKEKNCLVFECVLRRLEIMELPENEKERVLNQYRENNFIGFHTFGEQFGGVHVNQTLTGVAFGRQKTKS